MRECVSAHVGHVGHVCLRATVAPSIINSPYLIQDPVLSYSGSALLM